MNRSRIRRVFGLTAVAALMLAAVGVGPVAAKTPTWRVLWTPIPDTVKAGNDAAYDVVIQNFGSSNINRLTFTATPVQQSGKSTVSLEPTYRTPLVWSQAGPEVSCTTTGQLTCDLGTVPGFTSISFRVAYQVPDDYATPFKVTWALRAGTGDVEGGNQSRGDKYSTDAQTTLNNTADFDGGFVVDDFNYTTVGALGRTNKQTSGVDLTGADVHLTVNVRDGISDNLCDADDDAACTSLIGEWTRLNVPGSTGYLKVTLNIWGGSVPGGTGTGDIFLVHVLDNGDVEVIGDDVPGEICADANTAPSSGECIVVTKVGNNYRIVAWLLKNGTLRGGF